MRPIISPGKATRHYVDGGPALWARAVWPWLIAGLIYFAVRVPTLPPSSDVPGENDATAALRALVLTRQELVQDAVSRTMAAWLPAAWFLLLPVFAALLGLIFRRSPARYLHHVHLALHLHAVWFAGAALTVLVYLVDPTIDAVRLAAIACGVWYSFRALRVVYGRTRRATLWRMLLVGVAYGLISAAALLAIAVPLALVHNRAR